uniref:Ankyrin-3-like n=1 Tax=Diabrotica virgifera virgifera TaxID=50390 RepID=A0A6P7GSJ5_DIAVI
MNVSEAKAASLLSAIRNEIVDETDLAFVNAINIKQCGNCWFFTNGPCEHDWSVLNCAAYYGKVSILQLLLKNEKLIEKEDLNTSLHIAVENDHNTVVELLLKHGANIDAKNAYQPVPKFYFREHLLHRAVRKNSKEITLLLINNGANKEILDFHGMTPLLKAVKFGHKLIVKILIEVGASTSVRNNFEETPLPIAVRFNYKDIVNILVEAGADTSVVNIIKDTPLHIAVKKNFKEMTLLLINNGANKEIRNNDGLTPLLIAVICKYKDIVNILIEAGADTSVTDNFQNTLLHLAVINNSKEITLLLIKNGANKESRNGIGATPLLIAVESNYKDIANILIEAGADILVTNVFRMEIPLYPAVKCNGHTTVVELLLKHKTNVYSINAYNVIENNFPETLLHLAVIKNSKEVTLLLINNGANKEIRNKDGATPLLMAVDYNYEDIVKILIEAGANVNARNDFDTSSLDMACQRGLSSIVELLLDAGVNINIQNARGWTPLLIATYNVDLDIIQLLLKNRTYVYNRNADGDDVFDLAFRGGDDLLKFVIKLILYSNINTPKPEHHNNVDFLKFWDSCKSELELMEMCKIDKSSLSYRRLMLERNKSKLAAYCCNENIVRELDTLDYKNKFPIYNQYINEKIIEGEIRLRLYYKANKVMNHISSFLPITVRRIIYKYLSNDDLENLTGWDQHV